MTQVNVLILGANSRDTTRLRTDVEARDIKEEFVKAGARDAFQIEIAFAVRPEDLQNQLLSHQPHVLHFSGHGSARGVHRDETAPRQDGTRDLLPPGEDDGAPTGSGGWILLDDQQGAAVGVRPQALTELLEIVKRDSHLRGVILNACFSAEQAKAIAQHVDCIVGMKRAIDDRAAIAFAVGFYRAIARRKSIRTAFDLGRNEIDVRGLPDADVPELFCRPGVDPNETFIIPADAPSQPGKAGKGLSLPVLAQRLRRAAPMVASLLCILAAGAVFLPSPRVLAGPDPKRTIVVAGPWLASSASREARRELCEALDDNGVRQEGEPRVTCLALPLLGASDESVREKAQEAGASLLVLVNGEGTARIRPLGSLSDDEVFDRGLPRVELSNPAAREWLAPILRSLAHIVEFGGDGGRFNPSRLRCTPVSAGAPPSITLLALLTGMFVPGCKVSRVDWDELRGPCREALLDSDECKLVTFLYVSASPSAPDADTLRRSLKDASYRFLSVALLQGGRLACKDGDLDGAKEAARGLWKIPSTCHRLPASILAVCVLSKEKTGEKEGDRWLLDAEAFAYTDEASHCPALHRAANFAERGYWYAQSMTRWEEATMDFKKAYELAPSHHAHGLSLVEVLLQQGQIEQALKELKIIADDLRNQDPPSDDGKPLPQDGPRVMGTRKNRIHAALLTWIATYRKKDATESDIKNAAEALLDLYRSRWPKEKAVFEDASDKVLPPLACPQDARSCAYKILAQEKTSTSEERLRTALDEALAAKGPAPTL